MILDITNFRGEVWDLDTGLKVPKVVRFDTDLGIIQAYHVDERGQVKKDANGRNLMYVARGRFTAIPKSAPKGAKLLEAAANCVKCGNWLTLAGEELCVRCRAVDRGNRLKAVRVDDPLSPHKCVSCSRLAVWCVADEVQVSHEVKKSKLEVPGSNGRLVTLNIGYERGATVDRRYYCERCYRPPRLLDADGEVIKDLGERH